MSSINIFDEKQVLHELRHYLPSQTPIKDFIHHNTLHAFQDLDFYKAIFKASKIFGYQVTLELEDYRGLYRIGRIRGPILDKLLATRKGHQEMQAWKFKLLENKYDQHNEARIGRLRTCWQKVHRLNMDDRVHPLLFRILSNYLDQGIALWHFPNAEKGFLEAVRQLERNSYSSFFKTSRARRLLLDGDPSIAGLLDILVGDERFYEEYLFDQQFSHHGWSGMVCSVEDFPQNLMFRKAISLRDLVAFELLLEIDNIDAEFGTDWKPLAIQANLEPVDLFAEVPLTELQEAFMLWQDAFEWSYYDEVLTGIRYLRNVPKPSPTEKSFQAVFCIDERECSLRRHLETVDEKCETMGSPGFFGVEFYFQPEGARFYEKLCPAPVTPSHLIKESGAPRLRHADLMYNKRTHRVLSGWFSVVVLGFVAGYRLVKDLLLPKMSPSISNAFGHMDKESKLHIECAEPGKTENGLKLGYNTEEMTDRVERTLRGIGLVRDFAPLVYLISHGSSSANNPHHGAHDCGACSGRPGATNARVFSFMANHLEVRKKLAERGLVIPAETQFIGAMHDTASDLMDFYDEDVLTPANRERHAKNSHKMEIALDLNAKERSRRFASIKTKDDIKKIRKAIEKRSVSFFEPRPELGHGTNALCVVGRREMTKGLFLDRRAFMNSYDYRTDPEGKILAGVIRPLPPVCGGINLEYYFSRVDNQKFGSGTKLPHNVMSLVGVTNSSDGDLRPGLPLQMIEVHDPIRLLIIVEHFPEVVLKTIQQMPDVYEWFENEWVHLVAVNPENGDFFCFREHEFHPYSPLNEEIPVVDDINALIESAEEMETNHILHATRENLKVHLLKH
ncbi:MAG: hypothetical protein RI973_9 [Bacteroidota bacterium]|jgi:uncharacterized protein YbcC (UPF0753/DUF2309 family)